MKARRSQPDVMRRRTLVAAWSGAWASGRWESTCTRAGGPCSPVRGARTSPSGPVVALATLALVALCGCQTGGLHATSRPAVPRDGSARLIMYITDQPFVTAEPACRAVHALAKKEPFAGDYEDRKSVV